MGTLLQGVIKDQTLKIKVHVILCMVALKCQSLFVVVFFLFVAVFFIL